MTSACRAAHPSTVLAFAASDPTCGAGIQADILTIASLGCHPLSVLTAITAQDSVGVSSLLRMPREWIAHQAAILLADMPAGVFKIGLTGGAENITAIAEVLAAHPSVPVVLDPVLASGRGDPLADETALRALREELLPRTTILTPNSIEARRLAALPGDDPAAPPGLAECAGRLSDLGCEYVLLTGTHEDTDAVLNTLYRAGEIVRSDAWPRLPHEYHGSGCTLAAAVAACLARGLPPAEAVAEAQRHTWNALAAAFAIGRGQHIPNRFYAST